MVEFIEKFKTYGHLAGGLDALMYLEQISEEMIFSNYIAVWPTLPLPARHLTTEENMTLMNLKMRATVKIS